VSLRGAPGRVRVQARREGGVLVLEVHDAGSARGALPAAASTAGASPSASRGSGASLGLSTTRARREARYGADASLERCADAGGSTARLRLPYRAQRRAA
jgi:LytS/YehU family sensor histidine kinase